MSWRRIARWTALAVAALAMLAWAFMPRAIEVELGRVHRGPFVETLSDDGITRVRERYVITAPVSGTMLRPALKPGDAVAREEVVATIIPSTPELLDPRTYAELVARRNAAEARSARARTLVREAETAKQQAELDVRRIEDLAAQGYVSSTQREQAALALDARRRALEAARFEADASAHELEQAKAALSRLDEARRERGAIASAWKVRSPIAGRVLVVARESGGPVTVGTELLDIADVRQLEAVIDVLSNEATRIRPGAPVTLSAGSDVVLTGRVRTIEPAARTKISALGVEEQRVNVLVDLDPTSGETVGDGYRVEARIEVARTGNALQVPTASLFRRGQQWAVYAVKNGRARAVPVSLGTIGTETAIVLSGLAEGDRVVLYPSDELADGSRVTERPAS